MRQGSWKPRTLVQWKLMAEECMHDDSGRQKGAVFHSPYLYLYMANQSLVPQYYCSHSTLYEVARLSRSNHFY